MKDHQKSPKERGCSAWLGWPCVAVVGIFILMVVPPLWPGVIPFTVWGLWEMRGHPMQWVASSFPILIWGVVYNALCDLLTEPRHTDVHPKTVLAMGTVLSTCAGLVEEIAFRWLIFLSMIAWVTLLNVLTFGLLEWVHAWIGGPVANLLTLGHMEPLVLHPRWTVGAALLCTNALFSNAHRYQGRLGALNAWYLGMFLFWFMFEYGLPLAIAAHLIYNLLIYMYAALRNAWIGGPYRT